MILKVKVTIGLYCIYGITFHTVLKLLKVSFLFEYKKFHQVARNQTSERKNKYQRCVFVY